MIRFIIFVSLLSLAIAASAEAPLGFERANANAEAQLASQPEASSTYAEAWAAFNNEHHLDERDGCYFKADGALTQILELDSTGKVVGYYADQENGRAQCWRQTYMGVVFPKPPFAPYWHKLVMH